MADTASGPLREFGVRVRAQRQALGLSQEGLAEKADLHWSYVGQVERGKHAKNGVGLLAILKLADALGLDPAELVGGLRRPA